MTPKHDEAGHLLLSKAVPLRSKVFLESFYRGIDAGIRFPLRVLHAHGFETCQSCQGGKGHAYLEPTIDMVAGGASDSEGIAALGPLAAYGLPVSTVGIIWNIEQGLPYEKLWRITFRTTMEDRANDKPIFIWGYQAQ
jgi:hypothetical protein